MPNTVYVVRAVDYSIDSIFRTYGVYSTYQLAVDRKIELLNINFLPVNVFIVGYVVDENVGD